MGIEYKVRMCTYIHTPLTPNVQRYSQTILFFQLLSTESFSCWKISLAKLGGCLRYDHFVSFVFFCIFQQPIHSFMMYALHVWNIRCTCQISMEYEHCYQHEISTKKVFFFVLKFYRLKGRVIRLNSYEHQSVQNFEGGVYIEEKY